MNAPTNERERKNAIRIAAESLTLSIIPADGYDPEKIGREFADAIMKTIENHPDVIGEGIDIDLGHECLEMILSRAIHRLNEHFEKRNNQSA